MAVIQGSVHEVALTAAPVGLTPDRDWLFSGRRGYINRQRITREEGE
jgi:hypothetical protein